MLIVFVLLLIGLLNEPVTIGVNPLAHLFAMEVLLNYIGYVSHVTRTLSYITVMGEIL